MSTSTVERTSTHTSTHTGIEERRTQDTWVCDNCHAESAVVRKRCGDCGTSRY